MKKSKILSQLPILVIWLWLAFGPALQPHQIAYRQKTDKTPAHSEIYAVKGVLDFNKLPPGEPPPEPMNIPSITYAVPDAIIPEGCELTTNIAFELTLIKLINEERERRGRDPLTLNAQLGNAARQHSIFMACEGFFSHTAPSGYTFADRVSASGYDHFAVGENIYAGDDHFNSPLRAFKAWFYSSYHFRVMIHPMFTEVGIGYVFGPDSQHGGYFTADFASPE